LPRGKAEAARGGEVVCKGNKAIERRARRFQFEFDGALLQFK
jgi:hypothetical protein